LAQVQNNDNWDTASNRAAEAGEGGAAPAAEGKESSYPFDPKRTFREAWRSSTDFYTSGIQSQWDKNLRNWQGRHPADSKYNSPTYATRSRLFRPKTRANTRKNEAAAASAFFSTQDVVSITAADEANDAQRASAAVVQALLQYRLTETIPWFLTCVGAKQDTEVYGACFSRQAWRYEEREVKWLEPKTQEVTGPDGQAFDDHVHDENGTPVYNEMSGWEVVRDEPEIDLIPPENVRFDPGADWRDPISTSPYLIVRWPLYAGDVKARALAENSKTGNPDWIAVSDADLGKARTTVPDQTRQTRQGNRPDPQDQQTGISDFETVWVNEVVIRWQGRDWHYYTLGEDGTVLSRDVRPLEEVYPHLPTAAAPSRWASASSRRTRPCRPPRSSSPATSSPR
jgi:hypothetical protein